MAATPDGRLKRFYLLLGGLAVLGIGALGFLAMRPRNVSIPANVAVTAADTAGFRGYVLGSDSAPVEVIEYADFQCPACQTFETVQFPDVRQRLIDAGRVRWVYRDFPLEQHRNARLAAHAAACAADQGRYWEMHRFLYEGQGDWFGVGNASGEFRSYARSAGVNLDPYDDCMTSARYAGRIQATLLAGQQLGVSSTPTFLIGGRLYPGVMPYDRLRQLIDSLTPRPTP